MDRLFAEALTEFASEQKLNEEHGGRYSAPKMPLVLRLSALRSFDAAPFFKSPEMVCFLGVCSMTSETFVDTVSMICLLRVFDMILCVNSLPVPPVYLCTYDTVRYRLPTQTMGIMYHSIYCVSISAKAMRDIGLSCCIA